MQKTTAPPQVGSKEKGVNLGGAPGGPSSLCNRCDGNTQPYERAWRRLSRYLHENWAGIVRRGSFDLSKTYPNVAASLALDVHLHFVKLLGCKLFTDNIKADLAPFVSALLARESHPEVTLLVANCIVSPGRFLYYESEVSVLRRDDEIYSAVWMNLEYPVAIKVCYLRGSAPVVEPDGFPWHPTRQRKLVKLSPYKGDTKPLVARRDLRM